jgi:hypothetical protein
MIDILSPASRRLVALGLLVLVLVSALNFIVMPVSGAISAALDALAEARFERARLVAIDEGPRLRKGIPVPAALLLRAPTHDVAGATLVNLIRTAADAQKITLDPVVPLVADPARPMTVGVGFATTAPEADVAAFISALEQGEPAVRLDQWKLSAVENTGGQVRLEARAMALWTS